MLEFYKQATKQQIIQVGRPRKSLKARLLLLMNILYIKQHCDIYQLLFADDSITPSEQTSIN